MNVAVAYRSNRTVSGFGYLDVPRQKLSAAWGILVVILLGIFAPGVSAQRGSASPSLPVPDPAEALQDTLTAACRHDEAAFAGHLTSDSAQAYRALTQEQRITVLRRLVLIDDPGRPLLSASGGSAVVRCEAGGVTTEMRFGAPEVRENLAFIPVSVPEGGETQSVRFGLVRESGQWKLLSVGLLMLDIPALGRQWEQSDLQARERSAIEAMRKVGNALKTYQTAYGNLPETLQQLGPPGQDGASPEMAGLLDSDLAKGLAGGYRLRYSIVPASGDESESERNKAAGFMLAGTPVVYGKDGRRSFLLDAAGSLRGGDKNGAIASPDDPSIGNENTQQ